MPNYIQPETKVAEVAMTTALLVVSTGPTLGVNMNIGGSGDPISGR